MYTVGLRTALNSLIAHYFTGSLLRLLGTIIIIIMKPKQVIKTVRISILNYYAILINIQYTTQDNVGDVMTKLFNFEKS